MKLIEQAIAFHQRGNLVDAEIIYKKVLRVHPKNFDALHMLGIIRAQSGSFEEAEKYLRKALSIDPRVAQCFHNHGTILAKLKRNEDALNSYNSAIKLAPNHAPIYSDRGHVLYALKRYEEAAASYDNALALNPDLADAYNGRGNVLYDLKRHDEALAAYDKALALNPNLEHAWLGRGNVLYGLKRHSESLAAYDRALALKPDLETAWLGRGNTLYAIKRYKDALADFDKSLSLKPDLEIAWLGRGNVLHEFKHYDDAFSAYDRAIAVRSDLVTAWLGRGRSHFLLGRPDEGAADYRQALKLGGDPEIINYELASFGAESTPDASPVNYVVTLFDHSADEFDKHLVDELKYTAPISLFNVIERGRLPKSLDVLDLGCGTGLMGAQLRPFAKTLTGVDLSPGMLEKAKQRGLYDDLTCNEITQFLSTQNRRYDLVVATDVFIYLGDLSLVFQLVRQALRDGGSFGFSVESVDGADFVLRNTGRYAHSTDYLKGLATAHRFMTEIIEPAVIRQEAGRNVEGNIVLMRCS